MPSKNPINIPERLQFLYGRHGEIERAIARINPHDRHELSPPEAEEKEKLMWELNNVITEIERLEARDAINK